MVLVLLAVYQSSLHQLYINQHKFPTKVFLVSGQTLWSPSIIGILRWNFHLFELNPFCGLWKDVMTLFLFLSSLLYSCLHRAFKDGPPIYRITSPRVSFVGEVFLQQLWRRSLLLLRPQFPFFHPDLPGWVSKGDTTGRLRLNWDFASSSQLLMSKASVEMIKVGQNDQINQRTVKEEQERWRQLRILKSWESESVTTSGLGGDKFTVITNLAQQRWRTVVGQCHHLKTHVHHYITFHIASLQTQCPTPQSLSLRPSLSSGQILLLNV